MHKLTPEQHKKFLFQNSEGFTLIEVLVAMTILALVAGAMGPGFTSHAKLNTYSEVKTEAVQATQMVLDELRTTQIAALPESGTLNYNETVGKRDFQVQVALCTQSAFCPPSTSSSTRHFLVRTRYNSRVVYEVETVYTDLR